MTVPYRIETLLFKNTSTFKRDAFYLTRHATLQRLHQSLHLIVTGNIPFAKKYSVTGIVTFLSVTANVTVKVMVKVTVPVTRH